MAYRLSQQIPPDIKTASDGNTCRTDGGVDRDRDPETVVKISQADVLLLGPNGAEVVAHPEVGIPQNLKGQESPIFYIDDKDLSSPRIVFK